MIKKKAVNNLTVSTLARSYNILEFVENLRKLVSHTYLGSNLEQFRKADLHWLINEILLEFHRGECTLKAKLVEQFIKKNVTAAFEIRVNNSRVDFLTINGDSKSFEIKSELDNLLKLPKQISDYQKVFDYNYLVVDQKHYSKAYKLIPKHYGIMVLEDHQIQEIRPAQINEKLNPAAQLKLLTKKEFSQAFKINDITEDEVLMNFDDKEINTKFKDVLKKRYDKKWRFLVENKDSINEIDYQFFFQHNIKPEIIYGNN